MNMNALKKLGLLALTLPCFAGATTFHAPRPSAFLDTESVTNVAFSAGGARDFLFTLSLQLDASASNNVEVAFGRDLDGSGELDRSEADQGGRGRRGKFMHRVDSEYLAAW